MNLSVPYHILEDHFFRFVHGAETKAGGNLLGTCPICNEGKSYGKKKRFYFSHDYKYFSCLNCDTGMNDVSFMMKVCNYSFPEVKNMVIEQGDYDILGDIRSTPDNSVVEHNPISLPPVIKNISDLDHDEDHFTNLAIKEVKKRRLNTAVNKTDLYVCKEPIYSDTNSFIHKNRLIIPHRNMDNDLTFFQSRSLTKKQEEFGKYISCLNAPKSLWGLHGVSYTRKHLFITEGAFDAFFVKNCVATGGLKLNSTQEQELDEISSWFSLVYCYDNEFHKPESVEIYRDAIMRGENVFMWTGGFSKVKDFNEYCMKNEIDCITHEELLKHTFSGNTAMRVLDRKTKVVI